MSGAGVRGGGFDMGGLEWDGAVVVVVVDARGKREVDEVVESLGSVIVWHQHSRNWVSSG